MKSFTSSSDTTSWRLARWIPLLLTYKANRLGMTLAVLFVGLWMLAGSAGASSYPVASAGSLTPLRSNLAASVEDPEVKGVLNPVVQSYARDYGVSYEEAERRLDRVAPLQKLLASIREVEGLRLAGWGIDHGDRFVAWVWLSGDDPPSEEAARIAASHDDVEIRVGATHTYEELRVAQDKISNELVEGAFGSADPDPGVSTSVAFTGIDMEANSLKVAIDPVLSVRRERRAAGSNSERVSDQVFSKEAQRLAEVLRNRLGVRVTIADGRWIAPTADLRGGQGSPISCTASFAGKRIGGDYGLLTAGHCPRDLGANGVQLPYVHGWQSTTADAQFNRVPESDPPHRLLDDIVCGPLPTEVCDVTGTIARDSMIGHYVCYTGRKSGYSCGTVTMAAVRSHRCFSLPGPAKRKMMEELGITMHGSRKQVKCEPSYLMVEGEDLRGCIGDSGGPLYNKDRIAFGILTTGSGNKCISSVYLIFSAIQEVEKFLGVEVLTEDPLPPSAPGEIDAAVSLAGVSLSWSAPPEGARKYVVYRRRSGKSSVAVATVTDLHYTDSDSVSGNLPGDEYFYQVRAVNNLGLKSSPSAVARVSVPTSEGLSLALDSDDVALSWPPAQGDVAIYHVYRRIAVPGTTYGKIGDTITTSYSDPVAGLIPGIEYYYRIKPVNSAGAEGSWGASSNYAQFALPASTNLQAVSSASGVQLTWTVPAGDVARFELYRRAPVLGQGYRKIGTTLDATASFVDPTTGLVPGVEYLYRVKAVGSTGQVGGWGSGSNHAPVWVRATTDLRAKVAIGNVELTWTPPVGDVNGYRVYRRVAGPNQSYSEIGQTDTPSLMDPIASLVPGFEYLYRVKPVSSAGVVGGWGPGPSYASARLPSARHLKAATGAADVTVTWTAPDGDVASYEIYRRSVMPPGKIYQKIGETTSTETSYSHPVSDLVPGGKYYYRIRPVSSTGQVGGWGSGSNYAQATAPPLIDLKAQFGPDGMLVTWVAPAGDIASYRIYRLAERKQYRLIATSNTPNYTDPIVAPIRNIADLAPGVDYYYRVKAVGSDGAIGGWGSATNYALGTVPSVPAPSGLKATRYSNGVTFSWEQPTEDIASYKVYRRAAKPGERYRRIGIRTVPYFWDPSSELTPGTEYYYRVRAVNKLGLVGGWGSGSNYAAIRIPTRWPL